MRQNLMVLSVGYEESRMAVPQYIQTLAVSVIGGQTLPEHQIRHYRYNMRRLQQYAQANFGEAELLITGHSHIQVDNRRHGFINLGEFGRGWARYALIDGSKISVREENYEKLAKSKSDANFRKQLLVRVRLLMPSGVFSRAKAFWRWKRLYW